MDAEGTGQEDKIKAQGKGEQLLAPQRKGRPGWPRDCCGGARKERRVGGSER